MQANWTATSSPRVHSVSGSKCSFTAFIYKYYTFYYPTFFILKICFPCTYYEYIKSLNMGDHRARSEENSDPLKDKLGVNENRPFYQCARANARAIDAKKIKRSRVAQSKTGESFQRPNKETKCGDSLHPKYIVCGVKYQYALFEPKHAHVREWLMAFEGDTLYTCSFFPSPF